MLQRWIILICGMLVGIGGYCILYVSATAKHRQIIEQPQPELAWLKSEFHLSDAEFERVAKLHEEYLPQCAEMCQRIADKKSQLKHLLAQTNNLTAEIETNLSEAGQLRAECEKRMLAHFYAVSRTMPPEQGKRYLEWVQEKTILRERGGNSMADMHH